MDDEQEPLDPVRVTLFVLFLAGLGFGAWRLYVGRSAVAAVKEASKDYRKLFPSRANEVVEPKPIAVTGQQASGMMLKIDDDMRIKKPVPVEAPVAAPEETAAPIIAAKVAVAPVKPAMKPIPQRKLNSSSFSKLNGGSGVGFSGGNNGGSSAGAATAAPPGMPDLSKIPGMPAAPDTK